MGAVSSPPRENDLDMLIEVDGLTKRFRRHGFLAGRASVTAVDGVSFLIERGETLGLVGESGCGKSTVGRCLVRLLEPDEGRIDFDGVEIQNLGSGALRPFRRRMQIVFQNPLGSMNPVYSVEGTLRDSLRHLPASERDERIGDLLTQVGLDRRFSSRRRNEMSGGQLQRVSIARALASDPEFVFLDEPTSALDLSVRGQIVNLLIDLQEKKRLAYLFVSHDLGVVRFLAHRVLVMYLGQVVESAPTEEIFSRAAHPYTQALLAAAGLNGGAVQGEVTEFSRPGSGCRFANRCPYVEARCREEEPPIFQVSESHQARCWLVGD